METRLLLVIWASFASPYQILAPVDLQIRETALGEVTVSWRDSPAQELGLYQTRYAVVLETVAERMQYESVTKESRRTLALNGGVIARIATVLYNNSKEVNRSQWAEVWLPPHPGDPGTSVTNLSCITYMDLSGHICLNCTWRPGENAPEDTKYFLFYRYLKVTEECQLYSFEVAGKMNTGCHFAKTQIRIRSGGTLVIYVNGSSGPATIQPFYQLFDTDCIEMIFPPRNVTVIQKEELLAIHWECPQPSFPCSCFTFEVKITNLKTSADEVQPSRINKLNIFKKFRSKLSVHVRARGTEPCRKNHRWSEWSVPIFTEDLQQDGQYIVVIACILAVSPLVFIAVMLFKRYRICNQLFPQVPSPEVTLKKVFLFPESGELSGASRESEVIHSVEESQEFDDHKAALMIRK